MNFLLEQSHLPNGAGVTAMLEVLAGLEADVSVGKVCGGRVSAVWLGASLELVSLTLEPFELSDAALCQAKALEFANQIKAQNP